MFDPQPWLTPIEGNNPSGVDLRNDLKFHEIERLMLPKIEISRDDKNNAVAQTPVPIDWSNILAMAGELSKTGRDLRLLVMVTRALANDDGFNGLSAGFNLIAASAESYWETMHPELRASSSPRDAALRRLNALAQLQNESDGLLNDIAGTAFFTPRGLSPVTGHDLEMAMLDSATMLREAASGLNDKEKTALTASHESLIHRVKQSCKAFNDEAPADMETLRKTAADAVTALDNLESILGLKLGGDGSVLVLPSLSRFLTRVKSTLQATFAPVDTQAPQTISPPVTNVTSQTASVALASTPQPSGGAAIPERLNSRGDVEKLLDLIIDFYDRTEPSSPIPHLARRMRRMVPMDFLELMQEMAPSGLKEFKSVAGVAEQSK